ncbi:MAG: hypothetical protein K8J08_02645 [Thermoanaerobaculia bacterium]|nr:hypothetical protein [Thermoanaerobaculia bacterium]
MAPFRVPLIRDLAVLDCQPTPAVALVLNVCLYVLAALVLAGVLLPSAVWAGCLTEVLYAAVQLGHWPSSAGETSASVGFLDWPFCVGFFGLIVLLVSGQLALLRLILPKRAWLLALLLLVPVLWFGQIGVLSEDPGGIMALGWAD